VCVRVCGYAWGCVSLRVCELSRVFVLVFAGPRVFARLCALVLPAASRCRSRKALGERCCCRVHVRSRDPLPCSQAPIFPRRRIVVGLRA
jgi:hypothetical protein